MSTNHVPQSNAPIAPVSQDRPRPELIRVQPAGAGTELEAALGAVWKSARRTPNIEQMREILARHGPAGGSAARIVCLGAVDVPDVGALHFEPVIITPTRLYLRHLFFVPIAVVLVGLWVLQISGVIPGKAINIGAFAYFLAMGAGVGIAWLWRSTLRPTYVRMAPGMIQVLEFRYRQRKPIIRSYPLSGGTTVFITTGAVRRKRTIHSVTLLRDEWKDVLQLGRMGQRAEAAQQIWQALLSTAPTPPLSDEELVG